METETTILLPNNVPMPLIGFGTSTGRTSKADGRDFSKALEEALKVGYRHIDTAWGYQNEAEIGQVVQKCINKGMFKREDVFIVTKLHGYFHRRSDVELGLRDSLAKFGFSYVDLFLIHTPMAFKRMEGTIFPIVDGKILGEHVDHLETWQGMEDVYRKSLTKAIGLSNFNAKQILDLYDKCAVKAHNLELECHPYFPQFDMLELCQKLNITCTGFSPLGSPQRQSDLISSIKIRRLFRMKPDNAGSVPILLEDTTVASIAQKHKKTPAQILIRWLTQRQIAVIPRSLNPDRILENFQTFDFFLDDKDFEHLSTLKKEDFLKQIYQYKLFDEHPDFPYE